MEDLYLKEGFMQKSENSFWITSISCQLFEMWLFERYGEDDTKVTSPLIGRRGDVQLFKDY